jgi:Mn-dependent DtxR family transcriptional regulator
VGLVEAGLVRHQVYGKIELTEKGKGVGAELLRRSDCLTRLLVDILGMSPSEAAAEVHRMEHVLSDAVLSRLEVLVDFAASSPAWVRRLHHRVNAESPTSDGTSGYRVGATPVHGGTSGGQRSESLNS